MDISFLFLLQDHRLYSRFTFKDRSRRDSARRDINANYGSNGFRITIFCFRLSFNAFTTTSPIALYFFRQIYPISHLRSVRGPLYVNKCTRTPLARSLLFRQVTAAFKGTIRRFIINRCHARYNAPICRHFTSVDSPMIRRSFLFFFVVFNFPFTNDRVRFFTTDCVRAFHSKLFRDNGRFTSKAYLLFVITMVTIRRLSRYPLHPFVVFKVTDASLTIPIMARACFIRLFPVANSIFLYHCFEVLSNLSDVLFYQRSMNVMTRQVRGIRTLRTFMAKVGVEDSVAR